jgi:hypothetical protein
MTTPPIIGHNYLRPEENDKVPVLVLDFNKMYACWLPGLREMLYFEDKPETEELKRIREVVLLEVYVSGESKYLIELTPDEFNQFENVYDLFSTYGGEMFYHWQREGKRKRKYFSFKPKGGDVKNKPRQYNLDENIPKIQKTQNI